MKKHSISAFYPVYNDERTVEKMSMNLKRVLSELTNDYEIIIVDDNSPDKSGKIADKLAEKYKEIKVIHHKKNIGYGGALKSGFANATKELVFYTDGDAQYDVFELKKLYPYIEKYDVVNGYKVKRSDNVYRKALGGLYNFGMRIIFTLKVRDVDCDFRLMKRKIFNKIKLENNSGFICVEMMKKIQNNGYIIKNVPVNHYPRYFGESQFFRINKILRVFGNVIKYWVELVLVWNIKKLFGK